MKTIIINKNKSINSLIFVLRITAIFSIIILSFYINYMYIGGNNFLDMILFIFATIMIVALACISKRKDNLHVYEDINTLDMVNIENILAKYTEK